MAGVKGRSGRKSLSNEEYKLSTIEECWKLVREAINNPSLDYEYRVELASRHTVKSIPTEINGQMNGNFTVSATIQKEIPGEPVNTNRIKELRIAEYLIGSPPDITPSA